jgi:hypothetical protein
MPDDRNRPEAPRRDDSAAELDIDRVVWDPEYRRMVCDRLNRADAQQRAVSPVEVRN